MKQRLLLLFAFLVTMLTGAWADDLPSPVYFNDFSSSSGLTIVGNGTFELTPDPRFGKVFHNDPTVTKAIRTNWLELPSDIFSHSSQTKEMTIGFWVNKMSAEDYFFSPLFTAYGNDNVNKSHAWTEGGEEGWWPLFYLETRGLMQWNAGGWCDFTAEQNDAGTNKESTVWTDDGKWHYVTMTFTTSKAVVYVDGEVLNSWTIADEELAGLFTQTDLTHFCLGGNQAFGWNDPDPAFAFDNFAVYDKALSAAQIKQVMAAVQPDYSAPTTPLTVEGIEDGVIEVYNPMPGMQYSQNGGPKITMDGTTYIILPAGERIQFYGNGTSITQYYQSYNNRTQITGKSGKHIVYGNIMSLVDEYNYDTAVKLEKLAFRELFMGSTALTDASNLLLPANTLAEECYSDLFCKCSSLTAAPALTAMNLADNCYRGMFDGCGSLATAPALSAKVLGAYCYSWMFQDCTSLTTAPELPATMMKEACYQNMFTGCTSLTAAPVLPATTLADICYMEMFKGCTGLTAAPVLPATTLANVCYLEMFSGCTGLTKAPELPATTMEYSCYMGMFKDCTGLTEAPELPAATLYNGCYTTMFSGCTNLAYVKCNATDISAEGCTTDWLKDVAATGTFIAANDKAAWVENSASGIPAGWKKVDVKYYTPLTIKALTAGTIKVNNPKAGMKYNKKNGTTSGAKGLLAATDTKTAMDGTTEINVDAGDEVEFYGDGTSITSYKDTKIAGGTAQCSVYGNIMSLVDEQNFATATTLADNAFYGLFANNTTLTDASELLLPATTLSKCCYLSMFYGCTALTAAPALPATTLAEGCYGSMFENCTALTVAPELPATTLAYGCYNSMFCHCPGLTTAPELPATTLAENCYRYMFSGCTALTVAPELPATELKEYCYYEMFKGCTNLSSVTCLATDISATNCTKDWLNGVAATGTFTGANNTVAWAKSEAGVPTGWTYNIMVHTHVAGEPQIDDASKVDPTCTVGGSYDEVVYCTVCQAELSRTTYNIEPLGHEFVNGICSRCGETMPGVAPALTIEATSDGTIKVNSPMAGMKYSLNGGAKTTMSGTTEINVTAGDKVRFYGDGTNITGYDGTTISGGTATCTVYGNIMSLVDEESFTTATTLADYAFNGLFLKNATLTDASGLLLPATTLAEGCYGYMFFGCTSLTAAPELPATTLAENCYGGMFSGCTNLSSVTCLATDISANDCTTDWLKDVAATGVFTPANGDVAWVKDSPSGIPTGWTIYMGPTVNTPLTITAMSAGTIVVKDAKDGMRYTLNGGETTIMKGTTTISVATGDRVQLYGNGTRISSYSGTRIIGGTATFAVEGNIMSLVNEENFANATILSGPEAFMALFKDNTKLTDISGLLLPAVKLGASSYNQMFSGCTALTAAPELPATELGEFCYSGMFSGCTGLTKAPALPATKMADGCYNQMFKGCTALTAAPALPATELAINCYNQMFYGCTALTAAPALPAMTVEILSYNEMFKGCTGLTAAPALPATTLAVECYFAMFEGCTGLTAAPALPAATLAEACYGSMFKGCTGLTKAPVLPAAKLVKGCYQHMFQGCAELAAVTCLATDISATGCTEQWLEGVAETGVFTPANETVAWEKNSNSGIPTGWSGGPATGLNSVNADAKDAVIYDLMGRKVTNARRGMYILNGKKVVRK